MTLGKTSIFGWVVRFIVFLALFALAAVFQLDRHSRTQTRLIPYVPAGLGGFADANVARLLAIAAPQTAMDRAAASLRHRPVDGGNLSAYALAAAEADELDLAGQALTLAAQRGWRDTYTQVMVIGSAMTGGNYEVAAQRVDALARLRREEEAVYGTLSLLLVEEQGREELAKRLSHSIPLASEIHEFLRAYPDYGPEVAQTFSLALRDRGVLECELLAPVASALLLNEMGADALRMWPEDCQRQETGSYAFAPASAERDPFAWTYPSAAAVSVRTGSEPNLVEVRNRDPLRRPFASRYVVLDEGIHRLTLDAKVGETRPGSLRARQAEITVLLRCDRKGGRSAGALISQTYESQIEFTVPEDCPTQYLALSLGQGRVEDLSITID